MFHFVSRDPADANLWDRIKELALDPLNNSFLVSDRALPNVPESRFAFKIGVENYWTELSPSMSVQEIGFAMAQDIFGILYARHGYTLYQELPGVAPAMVMVDELATDGASRYPYYADIISWCGWSINNYYSAYVPGKWAVAVHNCQNDRGYDDPSLASALGWVFLAGGYAAFEMYPTRDQYCAVGSRDPYLEGFLERGPSGVAPPHPDARKGFGWAWSNWSAYQDRIEVTFGVQDGMVGGDDPNGPLRYMDRMFYVWKHYCFPAAITRARGGVGSWKWDDRVAGLDRDLAFRNIWNNYVRDDLDGPNYTVICS